MIKMTMAIAMPSPAMGPVCDLGDAALALGPTAAPDPGAVVAVVVEPLAEVSSGFVVSAGAEARRALSGSTIP